MKILHCGESFFQSRAANAPTKNEIPRIATINQASIESPNVHTWGIWIVLAILSVLEAKSSSAAGGVLNHPSGQDSPTRFMNDFFVFSRAIDSFGIILVSAQ
jgi:hypothetical protein